MARIASWALVGLLLFPLAARAAGSATFSLSADRLVVTEGEFVSVGVWVTPNGERLDTVRAYLAFTGELAVIDIALGSAFPRVAPGNGYDNAAGTASVGAFALGTPVAEPALLATVTFEAVGEGVATIDIGSTSRLISNGQERANAAGHSGADIRVNAATDAAGQAVPTEETVDTVPPNPIQPYTERIRYVEGEEALVEFATTDDGSGIDHYELSLGGDEFFEATSPYVVSGLQVGDLLLEVKAVDKVGNERYGKTGIRVYPSGTQLEPEDVAARERETKRIREIVVAESARPSGRLLITFVSATLAILAILFVIFRRRRARAP